MRAAGSDWRLNPKSLLSRAFVATPSNTNASGINTSGSPVFSGSQVTFTAASATSNPGITPHPSSIACAGYATATVFGDFTGPTGTTAHITVTFWLDYARTEQVAVLHVPPSISSYPALGAGMVRIASSFAIPGAANYLSLTWYGGATAVGQTFTVDRRGLFFGVLPDAFYQVPRA